MNHRLILWYLFVTYPWKVSLSPVGRTGVVDTAPPSYTEEFHPSLRLTLPYFTRLILKRLTLFETVWKYIISSAWSIKNIINTIRWISPYQKMKVANQLSDTDLWQMFNKSITWTIREKSKLMINIRVQFSDRNISQSRKSSVTFRYRTRYSDTCDCR